jgi:hypothetical protein
MSTTYLPNYYFGVLVLSTLLGYVLHENIVTFSVLSYMISSTANQSESTIHICVGFNF